MAEEKIDPKLILTVDEDRKVTWHTRDLNIMLDVANDLFIDTIRYEAIEHYKKALQAEPDSVEIRNNYGDALRSQDKIDQAIHPALTASALGVEPHFT